MSDTIVILGKGGVGKTTIAYHLLKAAVVRGWAVLGVDADAAQSLTYLSMGEGQRSLYQQVDSAVHARRSGGAAPRDGYPDFLRQSLTHTDAGFDLLTMGQPAGEGCYCAANSAVRELVFGSRQQPGLAANYRLTVMDCEAGSEKIARRMLGAGAAMLLVANPPDVQGRSESIRVAEAIAATIERELVGVRVLQVLNRVQRGDAPQLPAAWPDALMLGSGEEQLAVAVPLLLDQLTRGAR